MDFNSDYNRIISVDFSLLGNEEISRLSVLGKDTMGVDIPDLYENKEPKRGGLIDTRMGTTDDSINCATCGLNNIYCVGHFGHITLAEPVLNSGFIVSYIKKILSCICLRCSKLLIYKNENEIKEMAKYKTGKSRLNDIRNLVKNVTYCQKLNYGCGAPVSKIKVEITKSTGAIYMYSENNIIKDEETKIEDKKKTKQILSPDLVYDILKNISDTDCILMGIDPTKTRPEYMIHKIFLVPPVAMRPSVKADFSGSGTQEDDLTVKLAEIVKHNIRMTRDKESDSNKFSQDKSHLLQYYIASYQNSDLKIPKLEHKGKITKSIGPRLKGKEGRIRGNLLGKRVDFSARTVITSDPTISIHQLGVPIKIAMNLTFPEIVTQQNMDALSVYVNNGRNKYPGANFIFPASSQINKQPILPIDLRFRKDKIKLQIGDVVERHLIDGDIVLLNRQPTLHKQSMMGHSVKIIDNHNLNTFRLSVAITTPYNADFDGDEMNIFLSQSVQTQIELAEIADVRRQIITPSNSTPIIGIVQDGLIGSYNITSPNMNIDWKNAMNVISYTSLDNLSSFKKNVDYAGKDIFSMIIPSRINISDASLSIKNGIIEKGRVNKTYLGPKKINNLPHLIWDSYGVNETTDFLNNVQRLMNNFNLYNGFTVGIGDTYINTDVEKQLDLIFDTKDTKISQITTNLENNPDLMTHDLYERTIFAELNVIREDISKLLGANLKDDNNFNIMISSGSKGTITNIAQISGCVGLQAFEGKLIPTKTNFRTLPYFTRNDNSSSARGLIKNSYLKGMTFPEFFFHNMTGREGLIESAIKTAESGYIQRKLIKSMEDAIVTYDGTVRSTSNSIIQFVYGDSGADTTKQYLYSIKLLEMSDKEIEDKFIFSEEELTNFNFTKTENMDYYYELIKMRNLLRNTQIKTRMSYIVMKNTFMIPVNLPRIIAEAKNSSNIKSNNKLEPKYIFDKFNYILDNKNTPLLTISNIDRNNIYSIKMQDEKIYKTSLLVALHDALNPKKVILDYKFNKVQFDTIVDNIIENYNRNLIESGEMVGIIAAQSIGEPTTQMTLNSFHHSGIASLASITQGVPRVKELMSLTKNLKTPQMIIYLDDVNISNQNMANKIASYIKYTTIEHLRDTISVYYDPNPLDKDSFMELDNVKVFTTKNTSKYSCQTNMNNVPWLIRIKFNRESLYEKEVSLLDIKSKFCNMWEKRFNDKLIKKGDKNILEKITKIAILSNTDFDKTPIIHIRFNMTVFDINIVNDFCKNIIDKFKLRGIPSITNIGAINEEPILTFNNTNNNIEKKTQYVIYTAGINLYDIRYLNNIDINKIICNDVVTMYETFGIEAARSTLLREIIYAYERAGGEVNYHHVAVLIDHMTFNGYLTSVDRHGMNRTGVGPLSKSSFEQPMDIFQQAAIFSETDNLNGVSARIMTGLVIKGGTGLCNVILDTELIQNSQYSENTNNHYNNSYNEINENILTTMVKNDANNKDIEHNSDDDMFIPN
jgi:DNA-directed RNA polymerase II subunit RPB1